MPPVPTPTRTPAEAAELLVTKTASYDNSWERVASRSRNYGRVAALLGAILVVGAAGGFFIAIGLRTPAPAKTSSTKVQTLSPAEISQLSQVGTNLGTSNQILTIGANTVFQGKVNVVSDLTLGGHLNANGPVSFPSLTIAGQTTLTNLIVQQALQINGLTNAQNGLTVQGLAAINGNLNVSGTASIGTVSASTIAVKSLQVSGPLSVGHLVTSGPPITFTKGGGLGGGGTVSASGNDASGTIAINIGSGATGGTLITVAFRAVYAANVHVLLTPTSDAAALARVYIVRSPSGFSVVAAAGSSLGGVMSFDYFVTQ